MSTEVTTSAAAPATPKGPPPIPSTADLLSQPAAATAGNASPPANPAAPEAKPAGDPSSTPAPSKDDAKPADDVSLARIAREQRRIDAAKKELESERKQLHGAAADAEAYRNLQKLKGSSKLEAVKALLGEDAVEDAYWELNEHILTKAKPLTDEDRIAKQVDARLAAARKAEEAERAKAADEAKASELRTTEEQEAKFSTHMGGVFAAADPAKFPGLSVFPVAPRDIMEMVKAQFAAKGTLPSDEEILQHFERGIQEKLSKIRPADTNAGATRTITSADRADAPLKPIKDMSLKEITELALREANVAR